MKATSMEGPVRRYEADRSNWNDINGQAWRRAVLSGPTAYRSREGDINGGPGTATRGRPEQLDQHRWIGPAAGGRSCLAQRRTGVEKAASMQIPGSSYQVPPWSSYWMRKPM